MSSTPPTRVILFLEEWNEQESVAHDICSALSSRFAVRHVTVRSSAAWSHGGIERSEEEGEYPVLHVRLTILETSSDRDHSSSSTTTMTTMTTTTTIPTLRITVTSSSDPVHAALVIAKFVGLSSSETRRLVRLAVTKERQKRLVNDAQLHTRSPLYQRMIATCYDDNLPITGDAVVRTTMTTTTTMTKKMHRIRGKVRDRYEMEGGGGPPTTMTTKTTTKKIALVTTDRQSAFDRQLALVPYKGAVLNLTSAFWFEQTRHIIPNHLLTVPHPNVSIVRKCRPFPIEFVVRSYVTGSTSTSIWKNYQDGVRDYCGHALPEGLTKNQKLWSNLLTPTTKEEDHDRPISPADIVNEGLMSREDLDVCSKAALAVFELGQTTSRERGLILVDTKYEFGRDESTGEIRLIDEVHTPDSSRYWLASSYEERIEAGLEPENIDKEFLRLWFRDHCDPYSDETLPDAPRDLVLELSRRYITLYEMITWKDFDRHFFDGNGGGDGDGDGGGTAEGDIGDIIMSHLGK